MMAVLLLLSVTKLAGLVLGPKFYLVLLACLFVSIPLRWLDGCEWLLVVMLVVVVVVVMMMVVVVAI